MILSINFMIKSLDFECKVCFVKFDFAAQLNVHVQRDHLQKDGGDSNQDALAILAFKEPAFDKMGRELRLECPMCPARFHLQIHLARNAPDE